MEEILKKMEEIGALKGNKEEINEKQEKFAEAKNDIAKMHREKEVMLVGSQLRKLKEQEIENREVENDKLENEIKEERKTLMQDISENKKQLRELIDSEMKNYVSKEQLEKKESEIKEKEKKVFEYEKIAFEAQKLIEKISKELRENTERI